MTIYSEHQRLGHLLPDYVTLTVSVAGDGSVTSTDGYINCPGTCTHTYQPNTHVTLNASPAQGWIFSGWTGACSGVGNCNIDHDGESGGHRSLRGAWLWDSVHSGHALSPGRHATNPDPIQGGTSQSYTLPQLGGCNIPASAAAYSVNVTVVPITTLGYLTIWPTGEAQPGLDYELTRRPHQGQRRHCPGWETNGAVSVFVTDTTNVILDIDGYFTPPAQERTSSIR